MIDNANHNKYKTSVYVKQGKSKECINYRCDAPEIYKTGVVKTLLCRADKICSTTEAFEAEKTRIKDLLVNNHFPNHVCDKVIRAFNRKRNPEENRIEVAESEEQPSVESGATNTPEAAVRESKIYYRNQFHRNYRQEENAIRRIIKDHVFQIGVRLKLIIYYKTKKISNLVMKNNLSAPDLPRENCSHIVYEFVCNEGECISQTPKNSYIGLTSMTLRDRMSAHRYQGSIFEHFRLKHGANPNLENLLSNTSILYRENDSFQLHIYEALHIMKLLPSLNNNKSNFDCLKLNIF